MVLVNRPVTEEFLEHKGKFPKAFEYLEIVGHPECIYLSKGFSPKSFSSISFTKAILAETRARLGIFFVDFDYDKSTNTAIRVK
jgi:hypothetical protein